MRTISVVLFILENMGRIILILITLSLSYCFLLIESPAYYSLTSEDENIGKNYLYINPQGNLFRFIHCLLPRNLVTLYLICLTITVKLAYHPRYTK